MTTTSALIGAGEVAVGALFPGASMVLALLSTAAAAEPLIEQAIPTVIAIFKGEPVTSQQNLALWQAIVALEDQAEAKANAILAQAQTDVQAAVDAQSGA